MTILHPTDFSSVAESARAVASSLASRLGATVHVLHVKRRLDADGTPTERVAAAALDRRSIERERQAMEDRVRQIHDRLRRLAEDTHLGRWELRFGHPVREILDAASEGADLIVMGAHGSNRLDAYFLGGVAGRVARRSRIPIVTVRGEIPRTDVDHILMATDFSDASRHAWEWLRGWLGAGIRASIVHVADDPRFATDEAYLVRAREALEAMVEGLRDDGWTGATVDRVDVRTGDPIDVVPGVAAEWAADAICVGSRRRPAAAGLVFGSRADALLRSSAVPIVTVPYDPSSDEGAGGEVD